nr:ulp1 protease family, C-terminal catalytic domain-containing protein [Tanacetum cinerariifolium]
MMFIEDGIGFDMKRLRNKLIKKGPGFAVVMRMNFITLPTIRKPGDHRFFLHIIFFLFSDPQTTYYHYKDPPEPRTRRGINRNQDLPIGASVEFNQFGQAVGKWQYLYGKYIGTRTRRLTSILKKNWKQVTKEEKNFLWSNIKAHFRLENDDVKKRTFVSCGTKWKAFKTKLRVKFMLKKNESFSPTQEGNHSSVLMRSNLSSTKSIGRKEHQGEQNELISTRQVDVSSSVHRRSNLSSTTSIIKEEHQGEQNELISTRQVDVSSSVHRSSNLSSTISIVKLHCIKGHMKVSVIKVVEIHRSMKLPVSDNEIPNLESAVKGFIQWPIAAIARFTVEKEKAATDMIELLTYQELECGIVTLFEMVVSSLKWKFPLVNRYPGDWECGYYVMKWVHDFVLKYQNENFPNIVPWSNERPLENKELNAIIGAWKKHGRMMLDSIKNGSLVYPTVEEDGQTRLKKYSELTEAQQLQDDCDVQATNIILHDLPPDVYALVNHQEAAKDIWDKVKLLMKGTEL